ncbi:MAG: DUF1016 N-terminal domain-containing protein, partial [Prevotellaceae bacterium]|nr:DUF1016 N-terminal domain-containing protein [Prevotellaceae bacterium]
NIQNTDNQNDYLQFLLEIKERIHKSRYIRYIQRFYSEYQGNAILQPLVGEISWSKHLIIMSKCKNLQERQFYILDTKNTYFKSSWRDE